MKNKKQLKINRDIEKNKKLGSALRENLLKRKQFLPKIQKRKIPN